MNHKPGRADLASGGPESAKRQPKRGRLWLNDGSCIRLRPLHKNHVWSYDFVSTRTHDGRALKLLTVLYEYTRQCLAIKVGRRSRAHDVLEVLADLFARYGPPQHLRSDNGPEFTAHLIRQWLNHPTPWGPNRRQAAGLQTVSLYYARQSLLYYARQSLRTPSQELV